MELSGTWKNQLNSTVELVAQEDGSLTGQYHTAVSSSGEALPPSPLHGSWQRTPDGILFALTVQWHFVKEGEDKHSSVAWSGRGMNENPHTLKTTWVLTSGEEPEWRSVVTNQDVFTRQEA